MIFPPMRWAKAACATCARGCENASSGRPPARRGRRRAEAGGGVSDDVAPELQISREAGPGDVLGTWQMTRASLELLKRDGYVEVPGQTYTITFNSDGWAKFESVLDDVKGGTYTRCLGNWRLDHDVTVDSE